MKSHFAYNTTLGKIWIATDGEAVTGLSFSAPTDGREEETAVTKEAARQLYDFLTGKRKNFDLKLNPAGTPFQKRVWDALIAIPYGETRCYGQIAQAVGNGKAARAVGMANNRNPIAIIIPCHRVVGADGSLTGYAGGLDKKEFLLSLERKHI